MVIMVGPQEAVKPTHAMLNLINSPSRNILTMKTRGIWASGITQIVVPDQDLDFTKTLRAALSKDPDVILIGEIGMKKRQIAVKAALTGHLVLTTLRRDMTVIQRLKTSVFRTCFLKH